MKHGPGPKTAEEAAALPEMAHAELCAAGIGGDPVDGDTIIAFVDRDGRSKSVVSTGKGWVKTPFL